MIRNIIPILLTILLFSACSSSRLIVPLAEDQKVLSFSAGGALFKYNNVTIPIPLTSATYSYGVEKNLTWNSSLHLTSLAYGVIHFETGILSNLFYHDKTKLGISYSPNIHFMSDVFDWTSRVYPQLDVNLYYYLRGSGGRDCNCPGSGSVKTPVLLYAGIMNWFELNNTRSLGLNQEKQYYGNPHFGILLKGKGWRFQVETKLLGPSVDNTKLVLDYSGINGQGAIGTFATYYKTIGRGR